MNNKVMKIVCLLAAFAMLISIFAGIVYVFI